MATERTFIMIKPDAVQRGLIATIVGRFEQKGFQLVAMKFMKVLITTGGVCIEQFNLTIFIYLKASEKLLEDHYGDLKTKKFFPGLVKFMSSGPVVAMVSLLEVTFACLCEPGDLNGACLIINLSHYHQVWQGKGVVATGRVVLGETDPVSQIIIIQ